ncbi:MAG: hypothetical protein PHY99_02805 [Bacteroidales bacterium]|nr:hypothetical protein [Bacteroidales bacterium]
MLKYNSTSKRLIMMIILVATTVSFVAAQSTINVKFSVDLGLLINQGKFSQSGDRVMIRGSFNNWGDQNKMNQEGTSSVYSLTLTLNKNTFFSYKFYISTSGAANGGWETTPGIGNDGTRTLNTGTNALVLPVVFFDDADLVLNLSTEHFKFYCTSQDVSILAAFSTKLETEYSGIVTSLAANITQKITVKIYKNEVYYHNAQGYPEFPAWAVGSAIGKTMIMMASPNHAGSHTYAEMLNIVIHEFAHIAEAWKTTISLPVWLNEGVAQWFSGQKTDRGTIVSCLNNWGKKPDLSYFEDFNTFSDRYGYNFSYTIAEFIVYSHGLTKLADFVGNLSYSGLGYASKAAFQSAWHKHLDDYYINTPPPVMSIGSIRRYGENWYINYTPHQATDAENNTLIYSIIITGEGFDKTYADNNHSGSFVIPKSEFTNNTTYTVTARSYDGIVYTTATKTKTFTTTNIAPTLFTFTAPANGATVSYNAEHQLRISWSPVEGVDTDGDPVTDSITIEGNGLNKNVAVKGSEGFLLVDSADLKPGKTYNLSGKRSDGTDAVQAVSRTFVTPGIDGIENPDNEFFLNIFPVPSDRLITVQSGFTKPAKMTLRILSLQGKSILEITESVYGAFSWTLDISAYPPGCYFISLETVRSSGATSRQVRLIIKR